MIKKLLLFVLLCTLAGILVFQELERRWLRTLPLPPAGLSITIEPGDSLRTVASRLNAEGVLPYPDMLIIYARFKGIDQQIKHGEYYLEPPLRSAALLELLRSGKVIQYQVTLPEGKTLRQALAILSQQSDLDSTLAETDDPRLSMLIEPYAHPEGLFFPDTYRYSRGASDLDLLVRAHAKMREVLEQEWRGRVAELPYETPYEALIMASIIERETGLPEERRQIAGVFVRRLKLGMRLQTDPTVIYGIGPAFDGNLRRSHLNDDSNLYNSYRHDGLPPTPIALPGRASIHAALHPADGTALFFVARGDGGHVFSSTLAAHQAAVRKFQLRRRKDYRSTPEASRQ